MENFNFDRFINSFKVDIRGGMKEVSEWNEDGEGKFLHCEDTNYLNKSITINKFETETINKNVIELVVNM